MAGRDGRNKPKWTDAQLIQALDASGGMVHVAARALGCSPQTIYTRRDTSPAVAEAIENARGEQLDVAEQALKAAVGRGEGWAVCFTLKCLGKDRGYIERVATEHSGPNGGPVETRIVFAYEDGANDGGD